MERTDILATMGSLKLYGMKAAYDEIKPGVMEFDRYGEIAAFRLREWFPVRRGASARPRMRLR